MYPTVVFAFTVTFFGLYLIMNKFGIVFDKQKMYLSAVELFMIELVALVIFTMKTKVFGIYLMFSLIAFAPIISHAVFYHKGKAKKN